LEVADCYSREAIKSFESNILAEGDTIENCAKHGNPDFVGVNGPREAGHIKKELGKFGEPSKALALSQEMSNKTHCPSSVIIRWAFA
jgi:hypothetical protein